MDFTLRRLDLNLGITIFAKGVFRLCVRLAFEQIFLITHRTWESYDAHLDRLSHNPAVTCPSPFLFYFVIIFIEQLIHTTISSTIERVTRAVVRAGCEVTPR